MCVRSTGVSAGTSSMTAGNRRMSRGPAIALADHASAVASALKAFNHFDTLDTVLAILEHHRSAHPGIDGAHGIHDEAAPRQIDLRSKARIRSAESDTLPSLRPHARPRRRELRGTRRITACRARDHVPLRELESAAQIEMHIRTR